MDCLRTRNAFSLVELSIVLVILGLLVGGVLSGQSLIRAAELRSVSADLTRYNAAVYTFRDKYFALPGDMPNATAFWGAADNGDGLGTDCTNVTSTKTCNGNGDGVIGVGGGSGGEVYERFRFWQHLALAGLIEGNYTGVAVVPDGNITSAGVNIPRTKATNGCIEEGSIFTGWTEIVPSFNGNLNNLFFSGTQVAGGDCAGPVYKPEEMWNIDTKMDDGIPSTGIVRSYVLGGAMAPSCESSATAYNLSNSSLLCVIIYKMGV